jgi:hypothetical protein
MAAGAANGGSRDSAAGLFDLKFARRSSRKYRAVAGRNSEGPGQLGPHLEVTKMKMIEMKTGGFAIYDAPPALKKFLHARESGTASKELLVQLSVAAMAEQEADRLRMPRASLDDGIIDFQRARRERPETK